MDSVRLIENFVSWQGEGPDSGRRMIILRFKTCNRSCPWCDTSVKMRISAESPHRIEDIQQTIFENEAGILITGGEPTVERHFDSCLVLLNNLIYPVANVESNGYRLEKLISMTLPEKPVKFIYSPKIFVDEDYDEAVKFVKDVLIYDKRIVMKLVYDGSPIMEDFMKYVSSFFKSKKSSDNKFLTTDKVWVMPEGTTSSNLIINSAKVFDICEKYNFNFSSRNHIIYGFI